MRGLSHKTGLCSVLLACLLLCFSFVATAYAEVLYEQTIDNATSANAAGAGLKQAFGTDGTCGSEFVGEVSAATVRLTSSSAGNWPNAQAVLSTQTNGSGGRAVRFESNVMEINTGSTPQNYTFTFDTPVNLDSDCVAPTSGNNVWHLAVDGVGSFSSSNFYQWRGSSSDVFASSSCIAGCNTIQDYYFVLHTGDVVVDVQDDIAVSTTWEAGKTYVVSGEVAVDSGVTLTVEPGAIVKFDTATSSSLIINGTLDALDAASASTTFFTSIADDLAGGDTNEDGFSSGEEGDWAGIRVNSGGTAMFGKTVIRYGGATGTTSSAMLYNNGGTLTLATSTAIVHGAGYGVRNDSGTTNIVASDIGFNDYGLYLDGGSISITASSTIHDNTTYGAFNNTSATSSFFAENNYWATATSTATSGPYNLTYNSDGTGDAVSDYIDFDLWIGAGSTVPLHYVIKELLPDCVSFNLCWSVENEQLLLDASTTPYATETNSATSTWNAENRIEIIAPTSTPADLILFATSTSDTWSKGWWEPIYQEPDLLYLNTYYLDENTSSQRQNTITHELGHALGLDHSYTGNIMFLGQSDQTTLGPQDVLDYEYLWP